MYYHSAIMYLIFKLFYLMLISCVGEIVSEPTF